MKKVLLLAATALLAVADVSAQKLQSIPYTIAASAKGQPAAASAARKAATLDGTLVWGYFDGPSDEWLALGNGNTGQVFSVAYFVPGDGVLSGASVNGVNVPVADAGITDVSVWVRNTLTDAPIATAAVAGPFKAGSFATVALDEPQPIPAAGFYVGYTFTNSTNYCIPTAGNDQPGGLFLSMNGGAFDDYSAQDFGTSVHQLLLSGVTLPDYDVELTALPAINTVAGGQFQATVALSSTSAKEVRSVDVTLTIGDQTLPQHIELAQPVAPGFSHTGSFTIQGVSPEPVAPYTVRVVLDKVNGEANATETAVEAQFNNLSKAVARRTVVEEFTGTGCGWCPRGWAGMERMKKNYPDEFIGIAFHQYNSSDPMYVGNYFPIRSLGITGAPGCNMNRSQQMDPYYGTGYGIWYDLEASLAELPSVDVTVTGTWNEAKTAVNVAARFESLVNDGDFSVVYVLTADSLTGTTNAWKQANYYNYRYGQFGSASELPEDLQWFYSAGDVIGQGVYVGLTYNDVMIGSSYFSSTGLNLAEDIAGASQTQAGQVYEGAYTVELPTSATLKGAIRNELVFAVALVVDNKTGRIANAAKALVGSETTGVTALPASAESQPATRYSLSGTRLSAPRRGLNIVRQADGTVRKVVVK